MNPTLRATLEMLAVTLLGLGFVVLAVMWPQATIITFFCALFVGGFVAMVLLRREDLIAQKKLDEYEDQEITIHRNRIIEWERDAREKMDECSAAIREAQEYKAKHRKDRGTC